MADNKPLFHNDARFFHSIGIEMTSIHQILSLAVKLLHSLSPGYNFLLHHLKTSPISFTVTRRLWLCSTLKFG